jgi:hypothetical protein
MAVAPDYGTVYVPEPVPAEVSVQATPVSLGFVGVTMLLVAAWGGLVPFVGPLFGFSADGHRSWVWDQQHAVLAVLPGAVGVLAALLLIGRLHLLRRGLGIGGVAAAGVLATLAGGWFVVAPAASRVVLSVGYFVTASPFRALVDQLGYAFGPGLVLVACGAFAIGWSLRQRGVVARLAVVPLAQAAMRPTIAAVPAAPVAPVAMTAPVIVTPVTTTGDPDFS